MGKIDDAVNLALDIARDDSHGYSQKRRNGPDYDCSSFLIHVWDSVGVIVSQNGASYTGNMLSAFLKSGFRIVDRKNEKLERGDVLLNVKHHTAMYIGDNTIVQATIAENGTVDGKTGDQTGKEIATFNFYEFSPGGWDYVLRYVENNKQETDKSEFINYENAECQKTDMPLIKQGHYGPAVAAIQGALKYHGFFPGAITGGFGTDTYKAVCDFQKKHKLEIDGIVGPKTWHELFYWR